MRSFSVFLLAALLFGGCVKNNPQPAWLELSAWTLVDNPDITAEPYGALTQNLTDAWVYVDNKLVGVYELPCKVPVLMEGTKEVTIYPAIRNNGISSTKKIYPFTEAYSLDMNLVPGERYPLQLSTYYMTSCNFTTEDFSEPSNSLMPEQSSATVAWENDPNIAISGYYGHIHLSEAAGTFIASMDPVDLPGGGAEVYLEIDYITTENLLQSVLALTPTGVTSNPNIQLNGYVGTYWKKIYIDLREIVSNSTSAYSFSQAFYAKLDEGETSGDIYLDNIRLVHF
jgi:hypothetical protein